jgi:calcineurin-like phosphoesterase family protein
VTSFFISDTHFGHKNIIKLADRPFSSVEEMDNKMVENWNDTVDEWDDVWFLGDFCWEKDSGLKIFNTLKGRKHLIYGNHEKPALTFSWYSKQSDYIGFIEDVRFHLYHYPIHEWDGFYRNTIHLHGHVHGNQKYAGSKNMMNVSVENIGYTPISLDEVLARTRA